jgi:hypothetical protein
VIPILLSFWMLIVGQSTVAPLKNPESIVQDVYSPVPESERQEFRTAVESLLALEKTGDWGEVYDRLYLNDRGLSKKQFVDQRNHLQVVAFVPRQISHIPPSQDWMVSGCAVFSPPPHLLGKRTSGVISDFDAKRSASGWRFGAPPAITLYEISSGSVRSCTVGGPAPQK